MMSLFHMFQIDDPMDSRHKTVSQDDDLVIIQHVTSQDEDDLVVVSNETSSGPHCDATVGRMMARGNSVIPVLGTGVAPPTPTNYQVLQPACDVCFVFDGLLQDDPDEMQRKKNGIRAAAMNSCSPSMIVNPPAFSVESKVRGSVQRKTWGVPMR